MKKYLYSLLTAMIFASAACHNGGLQAVRSTACVVGKCCKNISLQTGTNGFGTVPAVSTNASSIDVPDGLYLWDSKMTFD